MESSINKFQKGNYSIVDYYTPVKNEPALATKTSQQHLSPYFHNNFNGETSDKDSPLSTRQQQFQKQPKLTIMERSSSSSYETSQSSDHPSQIVKHLIDMNRQKFVDLKAAPNAMKNPSLNTMKNPSLKAFSNTEPTSRNLHSYVPKILNNRTLTVGSRLSNSNSNTSLNKEFLAISKEVDSIKKISYTTPKSSERNNVANVRKQAPPPLAYANQRKEFSNMKHSLMEEPSINDVKAFSSQKLPEKQNSLAENRILAQKIMRDFILSNQKKTSIPQKPKYVLTRVSRYIETTLIREKIGKYIPVKCH